VSGAEILNLVIGTVQGLGAVAVAMLGLMIGVCVLVTLTKFRSTRNSLTIKSLDETVGPPLTYLPPNAPRGPIDQLAGSRHS
jgi:hypothetical protein